MASIFKISRSPFYFAAYRDAQGQRVQRTTKQTNRTQALRMAQDFEKLAAKGRAGVLIEAQARRVVAEIVEAATGEALQFHTCRAWLNEWVAGKRGAVAAKSIEKYEQVTTDFLTHLGDRAGLALAAIGPKDVRSFRDALAKGGRAPGTVNQAIRKVLSAPFLAAVRLGYIPTNPCAAVEPLKDDTESSRETFTIEQVEMLARTAEGDWRGAIIFAYYTGLRLGDIAALTWDLLGIEPWVLRLRTAKTSKWVEMPLRPEVVKWLRSQPRGIAKAPVFPSLIGKGTGGRFGLSGRFAAVMEKAGISGRVLRGSNGSGRKTSSLSFHSLRHTFVSALANAGVTAELRKGLSGHSDDRSHARYTHHDIENFRGALATMPSVSGAP